MESGRSKSQKKSKKSRRKKESTSEEEDMVVDTPETVNVASDFTRFIGPTSNLEEMVSEDEEEEEGAQDDEGVEEALEMGETRPRTRKFGDHVVYRKLTSNSILVCLTPPHCLYFMGKCAVKVLRGTVDIYGCNLNASHPIRYVFSPKGHSSLLCIAGVSAASSAIDEANNGNEEFLSALDGEELQNLPGVVFVMQAFDDGWSLGLRNITSRGESLVGSCPMGIGPTAVLPGMKDFMGKLGFQFVPESMWDKHRLLKSSWEWDRIFEELNEQPEPPTVCVFGGKGVGKSTFNRWLTNKLLTCSDYRDGIVFVDLDPGQTEFTPPGVISVCLCKDPILGPNFSHIRQPNKAVFIGGVSVADFPFRYLHAAVQLYEFISGDDLMQNRPVIINTMGYSKGLGVNLAVSVIKIFRPRSVIQLSISNDSRSFPFDLSFDKIQHYNNGFLDSKLSLHYRQAIPFNHLKIDSLCADDNTNANPWGRRGGSPKELRDDMLLSYFAPLIPATNDYSFKSVVPLNVSTKEVAIGSMDSSLSFSGLLQAMLGNLVALCEIPGLELETLSSSSAGLSQAQNGPTRTVNKELLQSNNFYGYGILRAFDKAANVFHIITPEEPDLLKEKVNVIVVAGTIGLPVEIYTAGSDSSSNIPYVINSRKFGSLHIPGKKYYAPKKVTHPFVRTSML